MPLQLLPKSAAAFAPRAAPNVVLNTKVEPWLTQTLRRINRVKRPLNSVQQHFRCLTETLGGPLAIWTLASLMLPTAPASELLVCAEEPLAAALQNYNLLHLEAYVVHVDMVSEHEIAFKLTAKTIEALIEYHKKIYCVDVAAHSYDWPEKDEDIKQMHEQFLQAANRFVYRCPVRALEGMEEDGAGELLDGRSEEVKNNVMNLFLPLVEPPPPQPTIVNVIHPTPILPHPGHASQYWQPTSMLASTPVPIDSWQVLPSTPSPTATTCSDLPSSQSWPPMTLETPQLPSPAPSHTHPHYSTPVSYANSPRALDSVPVSLYTSGIPHGCGTSAAYHEADWSYHSTAFSTPLYTTI